MKTILALCAALVLAACTAPADLTPEEQARRAAAEKALIAAAVTSLTRTVDQFNALGVDYVKATPEQQAQVAAACTGLVGIIGGIQAYKQAIGEEVKYPGLTDQVGATCDVALAVAKEAPAAEPAA